MTTGLPAYLVSRVLHAIEVPSEPAPARVLKDMTDYGLWVHAKDALVASVCATTKVEEPPTEVVVRHESARAPEDSSDVNVLLRRTPPPAGKAAKVALRCGGPASAPLGPTAAALPERARAGSAAAGAGASDAEPVARDAAASVDESKVASAPSAPE